MQRKLDSQVEIIGTLLLIVAIFALSMCGCKHCEPETVTVYREVEVPVPVRPPLLTIPEEPEWELEGLGLEADTLEALQAMTRDLLRAWSYCEHLRAVLEAHNEVVSKPMGPQTRAPRGVMRTEDTGSRY